MSFPSSILKTKNVNEKAPWIFMIINHKERPDAAAFPLCGRHTHTRARKYMFVYTDIYSGHFVASCVIAAWHAPRSAGFRPTRSCITASYRGGNRRCQSGDLGTFTAVLSGWVGVESGSWPLHPPAHPRILALWGFVHIWKLATIYRMAHPCTRTQIDRISTA